MEKFGVAEKIIQESGCGLFQVGMVSLVYVLMKHPASFVTMFFAYGIYNPGWKCLDDNITLSIDIINSSSAMKFGDNATTAETNYNLNTSAEPEYTKGSCSLYESCHHVEFDPKTSTILTEWGLICDKEWIASAIISIQMVGLTVGCFIAGQLGDTFGRKKLLYGSLFIVAVLNLCSGFSPNWQIFAALRFFLGLFLAAILCLYFLLPAEFLNPVWRGRTAGIPAWNTGGILFALTAMACEDWRILHFIGAIFCLVCCLPVVWVPESLRWLEVNHKEKEFKDVVRKINKLNKMKLDTQELYETHITLQENGISIEDKQEKRYTIRDIFRKGYRLNSVILGFLYFGFSICYYAISFGIKEMSGNIYINLMILFGMEIVFCIVPIYVPNVLGRKRGTLCLVLSSTICMFLTAGLELWGNGESVKTTTLILAVVAKTCTNAAWYVLWILMSELYPTQVRSIVFGYSNMMARVGGILAPFFIPNRPDTIYISYFAMGCIGIICCVLLLKLPETKGKKMMDTFEDE